MVEYNADTGRAVIEHNKHRLAIKYAPPPHPPPLLGCCALFFVSVTRAVWCSTMLLDFKFELSRLHQFIGELRAASDTRGTGLTSASSSSARDVEDLTMELEEDEPLTSPAAPSSSDAPAAESKGVGVRTLADVTLHARIARNVHGMDVKLYTQALDVRRKFELQLQQQHAAGTS